MNGAMLLQHAAGVIESREQVYGPAETSFAHIAARWSLVLGTTVTAAQVALCLIDLKLARLTRDPTHLNSIVDVASYAACLREVTCGSKMRGSLDRHLPRTPPGEEELFAMRWGRRGRSRGSW